MRFKPMQSPQRAFLHALAEDFGLDSESQDPEPHRHVVIFKTPRFVSAPMKTLGQCAKIRPLSTIEPVPAPKSVGNKEPWNGFLLSNPKFGLTIEELHADLKEEFAKEGLEFTVEFLPSEDVVLHAVSSSSSSSWSQKLDQTLTSIKLSVSKKILGLKLAGSVGLCAVDGSGNVVRREEESAGEVGWSQVAKGMPRKTVVEERGVGSKSSFTVLGMKKEKKVKEKAEEAVEDWEKEVEGWGDA